MKIIANRTRILIALLVMVILMQLFPEKAGVIERVAIIGGGLYFLAWTAARYFARDKKRRAEAAQAAADDREYREYKRELDAVRARHQPTHDLDNPTSISPEYQAELSALHDKHQEMLARKFGPR